MSDRVITVTENGPRIVLSATDPKFDEAISLSRGEAVAAFSKLATWLATHPPVEARHG